MYFLNFFSFLFLTQLLFCNPAAGATHALLVGVGEYQNLGSRASLEGPANDVQLLQQTLKSSLLIPAENITTLINQQATKRAILAALNTLHDTTQSGDTIFIYFSGHGTSSSDLSNNWNMSPFTGAFMPADFRGGGSHDEMMHRLLIGTRDLRPVLQKLEDDRNLVVAIDACHAGYTVRSAWTDPELKYRFIDLDDLLDTKEPAKYGSSETTVVYPYTNTTYLAASSVYEKAVDIGGALIKRGVQTVDGRPHGAFTDALTRGLQGGADSNRDGHLSINELYHFVRSRLSDSFPQTPQLLKPGGSTGNEPVFVLATGEPSPTVDSGITDGQRALRVELVDLAPIVQKRIKNIAGVEIVSDRGDLKIAQKKGAYSRDRYEIYLHNGAKLCSIESENDLIKRLQRQLAIRKLTALDKLPKKYNVFLNILTDKGVLPEGEPFGISMSAERDSYFLLFNIDSGGMIDIIYPYTAKELLPLSQSTFADIGLVSGPHFGAEYLCLVAFKTPPPFYASLPKLLGEKGQNQFAPDDPLVVALQDAIAGDTFSGGAVALIKTAKREDIVK